MEDRSPELDQRKVVTGHVGGGACRRPAHRVRAVSAVIGLLLFPFLAGGDDRPPVTGKLVIKGKSFSFNRAWLVRGPDTSDPSKPAAYLILSSQDLSKPIAACGGIRCVVWDVIKDGAVLEPSDDGHESFWLRVVSPQLEKEQQLSGRRFTPAIDRHDRLSGKLEFSYTNTGDEADLEIDAALLKEFPVSRP